MAQEHRKTDYSIFYRIQEKNEQKADEFNRRSTKQNERILGQALSTAVVLGMKI